MKPVINEVYLQQCSTYLLIVNMMQTGIHFKHVSWIDKVGKLHCCNPGKGTSSKSTMGLSNDWGLLTIPLLSPDEFTTSFRLQKSHQITILSILTSQLTSPQRTVWVQLGKTLPQFWNMALSGIWSSPPTSGLNKSNQQEARCYSITKEHCAK